MKFGERPDAFGLISDFAWQLTEIEKLNRIPTIFIPQDLSEPLQHILHHLIQLSWMKSHIEILPVSECRFPNCLNYPESFGYCKKHYEEMNKE